VLRPPATSILLFSSLFFFNDTATPDIYTLSLHDALPISVPKLVPGVPPVHSVGQADQTQNGADDAEDLGVPRALKLPLGPLAVAGELLPQRLEFIRHRARKEEAVLVLRFQFAHEAVAESPQLLLGKADLALHGDHLALHRVEAPLHRAEPL